MKLSIAFAYLALACASVDATKPMMHAGRLTLQDFLALRNGVFLPVVISDNTYDNTGAAGTYSAATPRATGSDGDGDEVPDCTLADHTSDIAQDPKDQRHCDVAKCKAAGAVCTKQKTEDGKGWMCYTNLGTDKATKDMMDVCMDCICRFKDADGGQGP